ncbi:competence protein CoiA family protein [Pseudomonas sp. SA3-5]|uniref:Competence protein CoiA family protein n=1 Tax=Pseudomonas aestuarii TaxID=3018340 RepID=A0ABT4XHG1_9PSED|nr:competence protein CoiA family protein [Pseudomonas aestuarii]MDA7087653.1 competence protein CoiA family protein [Pseudomonas aestuarii]
MSMFVALNQNSRLTTIDQALRGLSCNCTCVCCGEAVIARKGMIREHHFAHHSNKESCYIQRESLLHLYAKEVICDNLGLQLPPMPGVYPDSPDPTSWWDFVKVDQEVPQAGFQPDLVAHLYDGTQLFIEIAVTSFIAEEKLERIKAVGIKTIELDLSDLLCSKLPIPSAELKKLILEQASNITWIFPEAPPVLLPLAIDAVSLAITALVTEPTSKCPEHRFTIMGMWVSARILPTGSIAVRSWTYNPQITELLKSWRNQLGGEYNQKYKNWIYSPLAREEVMARLQLLDEQR